MSTPIVATKLYIPALRPNIVSRPRLVARLNEGLRRKLTLISAPAGFGKTTLVSEWLAGCQRPAAWVSLGEGDNDPTRFVSYLVGALQTIAANIGVGMAGALQSPQPPPAEALLTALLNDIAANPGDFVLVLDDYHVIAAKPIDDALAFLLEHMPPQMHLVIATREDPQLPLARLRAKDQLTELRVVDLRFTSTEAAEFLNRVMGLNLAENDIAALEARTEGWIAGLQLAALSMQGHPDATAFIQSFTGSHRFVLDYLAEEVLHQQPERIQRFLICTAVLDRLCGSLCDAIMRDGAAGGQATLEYLERANLFIIPLDDERRWYRYHHLFAEVLRQRMAASADEDGMSIAEIHRRASVWYEDNGFVIEAFHHAVAANDVAHAAHLVEGNGMPLQFRGAVVPVLHWLASLPPQVLDANPTLWVMYASALSMAGQTTATEQKLQAAERALQGAELDARTRNLIGHIAAIRALLAGAQYQGEAIIAQSRRALEYLHPDNLPVRTATIWKLGFAYLLQGDRDAASRAYTEAIALSRASGNTIIYLSATTGLGNVQESENQLHAAAQTYQHVLQQVGDPPMTVACEAHLGMARICYEWNDLDAAQQHAHLSMHLAPQLQNTDRLIIGNVLIARLKLARGDVIGAIAMLTEAEQSARQQNFVYRMPEIAAARVVALLRQGNLVAAAHLAQTHDLPLSQAWVHLAQGNASAALAVLETWRQQVEAKGWADEWLKVLVLQALAFQAHGATDKALHMLGDALALAEPGGFIRTFVDEGRPMAHLLSQAAAQGIMLDYCGKLLAAYKSEAPHTTMHPSPYIQPLVEPLSQRESEVLHLIAQGLSNQEISERLCLALDTVKGHNRKIFGKLQVQRRTEAVARARALGLL